MARKQRGVLTATVRAKRKPGVRQAPKMAAAEQLAHDLNNLLTIISGNLELLALRVTDALDRDIVKEAQGATELTIQMAHQLMMFGRERAPNPTPIDLNREVAGTLGVLRDILGDSVTIETRLAPGLPQVLANASQLQAALLNLANNARDAMPQGGRLIIESRRTGGDVSLSLTDTGRGMTPEVQERAFDPFFTTKGAGKGRGLGLRMVHAFARQSGGRVLLSSKVGHGTTVRLYLPIAGVSRQRW